MVEFGQLLIELGFEFQGAMQSVYLDGFLHQSARVGRYGEQLLLKRTEVGVVTRLVRRYPQCVGPICDGVASYLNVPASWQASSRSNTDCEDYLHS